MCCVARLGDCTGDFDGAALSYAVTGSPNYARQRPMAYHHEQPHYYYYNYHYYYTDIQSYLENDMGWPSVYKEEGDDFDDDGRRLEDEETTNGLISMQGPSTYIAESIQAVDNMMGMPQRKKWSEAPSREAKLDRA